MNFVIFVIAMATLIWGADILVRESERIAKRFDISEFVIGATLIALGTSLPEMAASIAASADGKPDIAIANVIGSNILNITLVLGTIFIMTKSINPDRDFFAKDSTWAMVPVFVLILMIFDGVVSRFDATLLLLLMGAYIMFLLREARGIISEQLEGIEEDLADDSDFSWLKSMPFVAVGLVMIIVGANFTIDSASAIAKDFGISEWVIGIVMVSLGTSLPELVVSISAAVKGKVDMAIGNIIGSNMANTTIVLSAAALTKPLKFEVSAYIFDITTMLIATMMLVFITANKLYSKPAGISLFIVLGLFLEHTLSTINAS
ncbi:K+-dependent Na+/Ca+ exchanger related-protein [hydrothermal vent metagenome]|uniref:K+-dependent Na+/Ca+ exchanger related-protein n=1 Tax=hydrothermal vent metagenome TaxID=652676 RepID=A0A1W1B8C4_9ZZZZ